MCWQSLSGTWALRSIPTIRSQGALGPACTSSTVPWQFLLPLEQIGASGFVGTPPCLAAASKQPPPVPLGSPASAGRGAAYFTHGHPASAHRYPAHTAAHPGLRHTDALRTLLCSHMLALRHPPLAWKAISCSWSAVFCRTHACRRPCNYHQTLGTAMAWHRDNQQHYRHTANCSPLPLSAPKPTPSPGSCCLALCPCTHGHRSALPQVPTAHC